MNLAWIPLDAKNSIKLALPNADGGWWNDLSMFACRIWSCRCRREKEGEGGLLSGANSLTVLSIPLTATTGRVGCCSITACQHALRAASALAIKTESMLLTVHDMSVRSPYALQLAGIFVPDEEVAIIASRADLVRPRAQEIAYRQLPPIQSTPAYNP